MENMSTEACVDRGARFLDSIIPDWFNRIDIDSLNMMSMEYCIIGNLVDLEEEPVPALAYDRFIEEHSISEFEMGFNTYGNFGLLGDVWIDEIMKRKNL